MWFPMMAKVDFNLCPFIGAQEQEKIYRQHLLCWDQAATVIFPQLVEGMSLIPPLNSPWWNIRVQNSIIWQGKSLNLVISSERIEWHTIYEHCTDAQGMLWEWFLLFQTPNKKQMNEMKMVLIVTGFLSCVVKSADRERWLRRWPLPQGRLLTNSFLQNNNDQ